MPPRHVSTFIDNIIRYPVNVIIIIVRTSSRSRTWPCLLQSSLDSSGEQQEVLHRLDADILPADIGVQAVSVVDASGRLDKWCAIVALRRSNHPRVCVKICN